MSLFTNLHQRNYNNNSGLNFNNPLVGVAPPPQVQLQQAAQQQQPEQPQAPVQQDGYGGTFQNILSEQIEGDAERQRRIDLVNSTYGGTSGVSSTGGFLGGIPGSSNKASKITSMMKKTADQEAADKQVARLGQAGIAQDQGFGQALDQFTPYQQIGQQGVDNASFLADPQAQYEFLQNNPLYQASLEQGQRAISQSAAASGRLAAGTTLQDLSTASLVAAQPLIDRQREDIMSQIQIGGQAASNLANLQTERGLSAGNILGQIGETEAAGIIGYQNRIDAKNKAEEDRKAQKSAAKWGAIGDIVGSAASIIAGSDIKLKKNIKKIGKIGEFNKYSWTWNEEGEKHGYFGNAEGVIAQEVQAVRPDLVIEEDGHLKVNYGGLL